MAAFIFLLAVVLTAHRAQAFENNNLFGISHLTIVVTNIEISKEFYTEVLGGMLVEGLSTGEEGVYGDSHFYRIFQKEIMDAQRMGMSLADVGVPDISDNGDHKVVWDFILFSNSLIQLMTFVNRYTGEIFRRSDPRVGNAFVTSTHGAFMADDSFIALQQIQDIIYRQNNIPGYPEDKKGFITFNPVNSFEERKKQPLESFLLTLTPAFRLANMRGPQGERWEIAYRRGSGLKPDMGLFCEHKAVFSLMLDTRRRSVYQTTPSKRLAGLSHTNAVVDDIEATANFYINILGGKQNEKKTFRDIPVDEAMQVDTFQDEIFEAKAKDMTAGESFGILPAKMGASQSSYDLTFILFDNFYMELYRFYMNATYRSVPPQLYRNWSSPAYTNNLHTGFWVKDNVKLSSFIRNMEDRSRSSGLYKVKANRIVPVPNYGDPVSDDNYSRPFPQGHQLAGYDYVYFKGPSGEQLVLTQFLGKAKATLKAAMEKYGALSTAFDSTNPWNWEGFDKSCKWFVS